MNYQANYRKWLKSEELDEKSRNELLGILDNPEEIKDRFSKDIKFGTGGIRGLTGIGSNRINKYVIRHKTQGLSNYIIKRFPGDKSVAIVSYCILIYIFKVEEVG